MAHSYISCLMHVVFSTKDRRKFIASELADRLKPYLGGIARTNKMIALAVGGVDDHIHILLSIPSTLSVAKAVQLIKGGTSKWIHDTFTEHRDFGWQEGYAAFSVSQSMVPRTVEYIENQTAHHRSTTFEEEFIAFLDRHGVQYDPRYVFG